MASDFDSSNIEEFEWDDANVEHIKKHDVKSKEVEECFANTPFVLNHDESHSQAEVRFRVYGQTNSRRELSIIFTIRGYKIRIISARDQSKNERKEFQ